MQNDNLRVVLCELLEDKVQSPEHLTNLVDNIISLSSGVPHKVDVQEYQRNAIRTFSFLKEPIPQEMGDLLHCAMGMSTEAVEVLDAFKKSIFYGRALDHVNLKEEIGDISWYIQCMCLIAGYDYQTILNTNIAKLKARYPDKFNTADAFERNLDKERKILENDGMEEDN